VRAQLLCRLRPGETRAFEIRTEDAIIGRDPALGVSLGSDEVSRQHARISWDGKSYWIEDLKSAGGTFVNGRRVGRERLRHLSVISLGRGPQLVFVLRTAEVRPVKRLGIRHAFLIRDAPEGLPYEVGVGQVTVGRSEACNLVLDSPGVSKLHARLERTVDQLVLHDLGSANGTFVNDTRVTQATLSDGDVVSFAGEETYRVSIALGEVSATVAMPAVAAEEPAARKEDVSRRHFSSDWKLRFEGAPEKLLEKAQLQEDRTDRRRVEAPPEAEANSPEEAPTLVETPPSEAGRVELRLRGAGFDLAVTGPGLHDLGREPGLTLRIDHPSVSRRHARLVLSDDLGVFLQDLGGANGTQLNGKDVEKPEPLRDGDVVRLGEVELEVSLSLPAGRSRQGQ
jgi:pSer/pThr/pTyr-binding forkhead associated (FHA) protein